MGPGLGITQHEFIPDHRVYPLHPPYPHDMRGAITIEIEKERIRGMAIMSEIARMRDLMMGMDLPLQKGSNGLIPHGSSTSLAFGSSTGSSHLENRAQGEPLKESIVGEIKRLFGTCEREGTNGPLFQIGNAARSGISEARSVPEECDGNWTNIFLAKPDEGMSGLKSKVTALSTVNPSDLPVDNLEEKTNKWSCDLCKIITPNESSLNLHLQGRKHKLKEAGKNNSVCLSSTSAAKSVHVIGMIGSSSLESVNLEAESSLVEKNGNITSNKLDILPSDKNLNLDDLKENQAALIETGKWSCALCHIIAPNERSLNDHLRGRKHKFKASEKNCGDGLSSSPAGTSVAAIGTIDSSPHEVANLIADPFLLEKNGETGLKEHELLLLQENFKLDVGMDYPDALHQTVELTCAPYQNTGNNEQSLSNRLPGSKHKLIEDAVGGNGAGEICSVGLPQMAATKSVEVVGTMDSCTQGGDFLKDSMLREKNGSLSLMEQDLVPPNLVSSNKNQTAKWRCGICQIIFPCERNLNEHLQGKKHNWKEAALRTEVSGDGLSQKMVTESVEVVQTIELPTQEREDSKAEFCTQVRVNSTAEALLLDMNEAISSKGGGLPLSLENKTTDTVKQKKSALVQAEWNCELCQVIASSEHGLVEHLQGKKHKLKKVTLRPDEAGENSSIQLSHMTDLQSAEVVGAMDPCIQQRVKFTAESLCVEMNNMIGLKEQDLPKSMVNLISDSLDKNQSELVQTLESSCNLCQVTVPNKLGMDKHHKEKKHKLKEASLRAEIDVKNTSIGLSPVTTTKCVWVVKTKEGSTKEGMTCTNVSLPHGLKGEAILKKPFVAPQLENVCSENLMVNQSVLVKMKMTSDLCQAISSKKRRLDNCLQGKKHKSNDSALRAGGVGQYSSIGLSEIRATQSAEVVGTLDPHTLEIVNLTDESLCLEKNEAVRVQELVLPTSLENPNSDSLNRTQSEFVQTVESCCDLCQINFTNNQGLDDHQKGKKHKLKEAASRAKIDGKSISIGLSPTTATKSVWAVKTANASAEKAMKCTTEPFRHEVNSETSLNEQYVSPLQENLHSDSLKKNHSALVQSTSIALSSTTATKSVWAVKTADASARKAMKCTTEPFQHEVNGEAILNEKYVTPPQENLHSNNSQTTATKSVWAVKTADSGTEKAMKCTTEPFQHEVNGEASLNEKYVDPPQENLHSNNSQTTATKSVWAVKTADASTEKAMKCTTEPFRHEVNGEASLNGKDVTPPQGNLHSNNSQTTATKSICVVETADASTEKAIKCTTELFRHGLNGEDSLNQQYVPPLQENLHSDNLKKNQSALVQIEWSSDHSLPVIVPGKQGLNSCKQGRNHKVKDAALRADGAGENSSYELSKAAIQSAEVVGIVEQHTRESANFTAESLWLEENEEVRLKQQDLPAPVENSFNKNLSEVAPAVDWSCDLCQITVTNKRGLDEHRKGKKHMRKEAALRDNMNGKNTSFRISPTKITKSVWAVKSSDASVVEGMKCATESFPHVGSVEACSREQYISPLQENLNSGNLKKKCSALVQTELNSDHICQIIGLEKGLGELQQGKKHKWEEDALRAGSTGGNTNTGLSPMRASKSVWVVKTVDQSRLWGVESSALLEKNGEANLKDLDQLSLQENLTSDYLERRQTTLVEKVKWSCSLCHVITPDENSLCEHLHGKKHKMKEAALRGEAAEQNRPFGSPLKMATNPICIPGRQDLTSDGAKPIIESFQLNQTREASAGGSNQHQLHHSFSPDNLDENHFEFVARAECSDSHCHIADPSEKTLNEHLHGKKHELNKATIRAEFSGKSHSIAFSPKPATVGTVISSLKHEGLKSTVQHFQLKRNNGGTMSKRPDLDHLHNNINSCGLEKNQSGFVQVQKYSKLEKEKYRHWCEESDVAASSMMDMHAQNMSLENVDEISRDKLKLEGEVLNRKAHKLVHPVKKCKYIPRWKRVPSPTKQ